MFKFKKLLPSEGDDRCYSVSYNGHRLGQVMRNGATSRWYAITFDGYLKDEHWLRRIGAASRLRKYAVAQKVDLEVEG